MKIMGLRREKNLGKLRLVVDHDNTQLIIIGTVLYGVKSFWVKPILLRRRKTGLENIYFFYY